MMANTRTTAIAWTVAAIASLSTRFEALADQPHTASGSGDIYFYPKDGQSAATQDRDRYECYLWAHKQTGVDPSSVQEASRRPIRVVAVPAPPHDTVAGAVTGAVIGAAVSRPSDAGAGAAIGAVAGAVIGASSDAARTARANEKQDEAQRREDDRVAKEEARLNDYRRALKACLVGRGYSVQ
jgi:outer membrane lipoprotein SlyB